MLRLYLDEDVDVLLARLLTARGYNCVTAVEACRLYRPDSDHLIWASQEGRVLITHNRVDFENLAVEW
jgi:hypothetical protein